VLMTTPTEQISALWGSTSPLTPPRPKKEDTMNNGRRTREESEEEELLQDMAAESTLLPQMYKTSLKWKENYEAALEYIREAEAKISALELRVRVLEATRDLQAQVNTLQLRVDQLEQDAAGTQAILAGPHNIGLRAELSALHKVLSGCVESTNRAESELLLLLSWRTNFTKVPSSTAMPSGFSAAFLAHLENVGKDDTAASVAASSDAALAVCVVKRFRASSAASQVCSVEAFQHSGMQVPVSAGTGLTLQQGVHQQQFEDVRQLWSSIKPLLLPFSVVLQDLEVSSHAGELELGLLRTVSEVTALRYLRTLRKFLLQLDELWNLSWDMASQAVTVDCILSLRRDHTDCHQVNTIKALRWAAKLFRLRVEDLYEGLFRTLVAAPASGKLRRESYPLPWRLVSYLEHALIFRTLPVPALLLAGAALACVYGSLRWSDSQHLRWEALMFSSSCLRALVFRAKTSRAGMPVAFRIFGVLGLGSEVRQTWLAHYLEILSGVWQEMRAAFGQAVCPDCLWFTWKKADGAFAPLSYAQSLRFLREAAGHHRGSAAELYSKDDVWSALQAQDVVLAKLQEKPFAVLSALFPLLPDFSAAELVPTLDSAELGKSDAGSEAADPTAAPQLHLLQSQAKLPAQDFDSSSSDGESVDVESLGCAEEVVFAKSGVCHFASPATAGTGSRHAELWLKPACGMLSPELMVLHSLPAGKNSGSALIGCALAPVTLANDFGMRLYCLALLRTFSAVQSIPLHGGISLEAMAAAVSATALQGFKEPARAAFAILLSWGFPSGDGSPDGGVSAPTMAELLAEHSIPEVLHYHFAEFSPSVFANVSTDAAGLDRFLGSLMENTGPEMFAVEARVRMLWKSCVAQCSESKKAPGDQSMDVKADSWSDPFPAKLSATTWKSLREDFLASYPSELLSPEDTPGARIMGLVYRGVSDKSLKWPQWKHRLSVAQEQSHQLSRPAKMPRLESLLFDDVPAKDVPSVLNYGYVAGILNMHANALALCKAAHLSVLKRYVQAFLKLCFPQLEPGFRGPSVQEAIQADEKAWQAINELYAHHEWELGDAVAEIIDVRMVLHVYLQPRLAASSPAIPGVAGQVLTICRDFNTKDPGASVSASPGSAEPDYAGCLQHLEAHLQFSRHSVRASVVGERAGYFNFGLMFGSGQVGLTRLTHAFFATCIFLNQFLRQCFPEGEWTSICVARSVQTRIHSDSGNLAGSYNFSVSLGGFSGGHLWLEGDGSVPLQDSSGRVRHGHTVCTRHSPFKFQADVPHATMPWSGGDRWSVTAYSVPGAEVLSDACHSELLRLGFPLPGDLLDDSVYDRLVRLKKEGDGGPRPIRTVEFPEGRPDLTADEQQRLDSSKLLLVRCVSILDCVFSAGGQVSLEQPRNALSWLTMEVQEFLKRISADLNVIPACSVGMSVHKHWLFASSWRPLQALASRCDHPYSAHADVRGVKDSSGDWASRRTAEFPPLLSARFADLIMPVFSPGPDAKLLSCEEALGMVPCKPHNALPRANQDGGGQTGHRLPPVNVIICARCDIFGLSGWLHIRVRGTFIF
ncbi:unnamed protein product, partial [Symbiodinium necroappetens]